MNKKNELIDKVLTLQKDALEYKTTMENYEPDETDYMNEYNQFLDEIYEEFSIGNVTFAPSRILEELDPIAYRIGLNEYVDDIERSIILNGGTDNNGNSFPDEVKSFRDYFDELYDELEDAIIEEDIDLDISILDSVDDIITDMEDMLI